MSVSASRLHSLAVDIGGSTWSLGEWADDGLRLLGNGPTGELAPDALSELRGAVNKRRRAAADTSSVGVAFPGSVDGTGRVTAWPNRPQWIGSRLSAVLGLPEERIEIVDDGQAALWGEALLGVGTGLDDAIVLTLGTGIGGGLLLRGHAYAGTPGDPRTLGHLRALPSARLCSCSGSGCLQTSLASLPSDDGILRHRPSVWPDGCSLLDVVSDLGRSTGVRCVIVTGGLMRRPGLRHFVVTGLAERGMRCFVPPAPERSSLLGALLRQEANV